MAQTTHSRRARAAILWAICLCCAAQAGLALVIQCWRPDLADPECGPRLALLRQRLAQAPGRPLVLVLGSSRSANGFVADLVPLAGEERSTAPVVFNMSMHASGPFKELLCLRRVLAARIHPDAIVLEVLPALLYSDGSSIQAADYLDPASLYRTDMGPIRRYIPAQRGNYYRQWLGCACFPWYSCRAQLLCRYAQAWLPRNFLEDMADPDRYLSPAGWQPFVDRCPERYRRGLELAKKTYGPILKFTAVNPTTDRVVRELLDQCRAEHIRIAALLVMPESSEFRSLYRPETKGVVDSYLASLCREYETRVIDAREWIPDYCFSDGHHLLTFGAEAFTVRLWQTALGPLLRSPPGQSPKVDGAVARR